ncbi:DUF3817 domain-containing protein [Nafulsella turpanensis]|uniref:DUF3817 domain-containing protein n=1 Tax=Nafulsella turpanensis TaxID=1265690 RepID=UPI00034AD1FA|nr:DUF3817 domain-containing protein [Nafulsella turpanensis]
MQKSVDNFTKTFRLVGWMEGLSFLLLLGVAMPLKYLAGIPEPVKMLGWAHGLLFMLYLAYVVLAKFRLNWTFRQMFLAGVASVIPFGPFIVDRKLLKQSAARKV